MGEIDGEVKRDWPRSVGARRLDVRAELVLGSDELQAQSAHGVHAASPYERNGVFGSADAAGR